MLLCLVVGFEVVGQVSDVLLWYHHVGLSSMRERRGVEGGDGVVRNDDE